MKPALYYAIRKNLYSTVVAVTSEKRNGTRWAGRDTRYNEATHGTSDQLLGKFETQEAAEAMRGEITALAERYDVFRKRVTDFSSRSYQLERSNINKLIAGAPVDPVPAFVEVGCEYISSHNQEWMADNKRGGTLPAAAAVATDSIDPDAGGIIFVRPRPVPQERHSY